MKVHMSNISLQCSNLFVDKCTIGVTTIFPLLFLFSVWQYGPRISRGMVDIVN